MTPNYGSCYFGPLVAGSRRPFWLSAQKHLSSWLKSSTLTVQGLHNLPNFLYNITGFFYIYSTTYWKRAYHIYNSLCFLFFRNYVMNHDKFWNIAEAYPFSASVILEEYPSTLSMSFIWKPKGLCWARKLLIPQWAKSGKMVKKWNMKVFMNCYTMV